MNTKPLKRRGKRTFIVDATHVDLDYNVKRKHRSKKYLKKTKFKMELFIFLWILYRI